MKVSVTHTDSLKFIDPSVWARIAANKSVYVGYPWLLACEAIPDYRPRYLLAEGADGRILGALPTYFSEQGGTRRYNPFDVFVGPALGEAVERSAWHPILLGGASAGFVNEVLIDPALERRDKESVLAALLKAFADLADKLGARSSALMYLTPQAVSEVAPLLDSDDAEVLTVGADTRIDVQWQSFDDYLSWLSSKRRYTIRREIAQFESAGYTVTTGRLSDWYEQAGLLLANLQRKYGSGPQDTAFWVTYLERQAAELDDVSLLFLCHSKGDVVAFSLLYEWEGGLYGRACGFDYDRAGSNAEYFNLAYYLPLRHAISRGFNVLHLGMGSYEAKTLRGARLDPLWSVVTGPKGDDQEWRKALSSWNEDHYLRWKEQFASLSVNGVARDRWLLPRQ
jgi:predicted N-acyltransferase